MMRVVSYGGGVDSTAMIIRMLERKEKIDLIVFADTGAEWPETYNYIWMFRGWLLQHHGLVMSLVQADVGPMYPYLFARKTFPDRMFPRHIEKWKIRPVELFVQACRAGQQVEMCLGIDYDEADRVRTPRRKWITNRYPLVDWMIGRRGAENIIKNAGLPIPMKSGCWFCPFTDNKRWLKLKHGHPELFTLARQMEENATLYPKVTIHHSGTLSKIDLRVDGNETIEQSCESVGMCGR